MYILPFATRIKLHWTHARTYSTQSKEWRKKKSCLNQYENHSNLSRGPNDSNYLNFFSDYIDFQTSVEFSLHNQTAVEFLYKIFKIFQIVPR